MISKPIVGLALACMLSSLTLAYAGGWLADTLVGNLLDQAAIVGSGLAAELVLPGSGRFVIEALEALWGR